jgi:hypothetical protein
MHILDIPDSEIIGSGESRIVQPWRIINHAAWLFFMTTSGLSSYYYLPISYLEISRYFLLNIV